MIPFIITYAVLAGIYAIIAGIVFATMYHDYGPQDEDTQNSLRALLVTPIFPLYWGKKLIAAIAATLTDIKEEDK